MSNTLSNKLEALETEFLKNGDLSRTPSKSDIRKTKSTRIALASSKSRAGAKGTMKSNSSQNGLKKSKLGQGEDITTISKELSKLRKENEILRQRESFFIEKELDNGTRIEELEKKLERYEKQMPDSIKAESILSEISTFQNKILKNIDGIRTIYKNNLTEEQEALRRDCKFTIETKEEQLLRLKQKLKERESSTNLVENLRKENKFSTAIALNQFSATKNLKNVLERKHHAMKIKEQEHQYLITEIVKLKKESAMLKTAYQNEKEHNLMFQQNEKPICSRGKEEVSVEEMKQKWNLAFNERNLFRRLYHQEKQRNKVLQQQIMFISKHAERGKEHVDVYLEMRDDLANPRKRMTKLRRELQFCNQKPLERDSKSLFPVASTPNLLPVMKYKQNKFKVLSA
eukprot:snap_masked-scaffold_1-processed-gene-22.41-mRNA-1 protein AED:1.00 eAED:1.00 QI:0/-1/0/0/-1/1/1/0/400